MIYTDLITLPFCPGDFRKSSSPPASRIHVKSSAFSKKSPSFSSNLPLSKKIIKHPFYFNENDSFAVYLTTILAVHETRGLSKEFGK